MTFFSFLVLFRFSCLQRKGEAPPQRSAQQFQGSGEAGHRVRNQKPPQREREFAGVEMGWNG